MIKKGAVSLWTVSHSLLVFLSLSLSFHSNVSKALATSISHCSLTSFTVTTPTCASPFRDYRSYSLSLWQTNSLMVAPLDHAAPLHSGSQILNQIHSSPTPTCVLHIFFRRYAKHASRLEDRGHDSSKIRLCGLYFPCLQTFSLLLPSVPYIFSINTLCCAGLLLVFFFLKLLFFHL